MPVSHQPFIAYHLTGSAVWKTRILFISKKRIQEFSPQLCGCSASLALYGIHLISSSTMLFFYLEMMVIEIISAIRWLLTGRMAPQPLTQWPQLAWCRTQKSFTSEGGIQEGRGRASHIVSPAVVVSTASPFWHITAHYVIVSAWKHKNMCRGRCWAILSGENTKRYYW